MVLERRKRRVNLWVSGRGEIMVVVQIEGKRNLACIESISRCQGIMTHWSFLIPYHCFWLQIQKMKCPHLLGFKKTKTIQISVEMNVKLCRKS